MFADSDDLFGCGDDTFWNTGLTLWALSGRCFSMAG